jgi:molecular chaperone GrpE
MKKEKSKAENQETVEQEAQDLNNQNTTNESSEVENTENNENNENSLEAQIEALQQKCDDLNDKNLRLMAEFDNYRKRSLKERSDLIKTASESVFVNILPMIDDFERALKATETANDVNALQEGVQLIYNKFIAFLLQNGVKAIPTENEVFNTDLHEAITTFPAPSDDMKGKIIDCATKGYTMNEKVIRFSKVVVGE